MHVLRDDHHDGGHRRPTAARLAVAALVVLALVAGACSGDDEASAPEGTGGAGTVAPGGAEATAAGCADDVVEGPDTATVEQIVADAADEDGLRSVAYAVSRDGELVAAGAIGESLPDVPATEAMHYRVGNVAFAYLGTLLLLLAEDGVVSLDTTVAELLPDVDLPGTDEVTLEMLIRNTSGWPDHVRTDEFIDAFEEDPFRTWTADELVAIAAAQPTWYEPGTGWSYSHTGHVVLGEALAAAAGQPLDELLAERVIAPMGLDGTAPADGVAVPAPVLHTFTAERGLWEESTSFNPSWQTAPGSVITSTVCDLVVSAEQIGSGALLSDESYATLVSPSEAALGPQPEGCPPEACRQQTEDVYYALGVRVANGWVAQAPLFGGAGGVHAYLPEEDLAIAIQASVGPDTPEDLGNPAEAIWADLAEALAPEHPTRPS